LVKEMKKLLILIDEDDPNCIELKKRLNPDITKKAKWIGKNSPKGLKLVKNFEINQYSAFFVEDSKKIYKIDVTASKSECIEKMIEKV